LSGAAVTVDEQILYQTMTDIAGWGTYRVIARMIAPLVAKSIMKKDHCRMLTGFDPLPYWKQVAVPAFMAFGEDDKAVPVKDSLGRIQSLGNDYIRMTVYPGMGHGLTEPAIPGIYRMSNAYLGDLVDFIKACW
jgi:pimeloyl-ACP methyl ester carboxylesterase